VFVMIMDAVITRLFFLVDIEYWMGFWTRWRLTEEEVEKLNRTLFENIEQKTPEQDEEIEALRDKVQRLKEAFQPGELDNPDRYARALTTFLVCIFYAPLVTLAPLIGIIGLLLQYCIDKPMLLRWAKRGKPQNAVLAMWSLRVVQYFAPLGLSIAFFIFLTPSFKHYQTVRNRAFLGVLMSLILILAPMRLLRTIFGCCIWSWTARKIRDRRKSSQKSRLHQDASNDYYQAQFMWPKEMKYHLDHFLYKGIDKSKNPEMLREESLAHYRVSMDDIKANMQAGNMSTQRHPCPIFDSGTGACEFAALPKRNHILRSARSMTQVLGELPQQKYGVVYRSEVSGYSTPTASAPVQLTPLASSSSTMKSSKRSRSEFWPAAGHAGVVPEEQAPLHGEDGSGVQPVVIGHQRSEASLCRSFVWEYETGGGFRPYLGDCQQSLEDAFNAWEAGRGETRILLETCGKKVTVDFSRMTQKMAHPGGKIRKIRRRDKE